MSVLADNRRVLAKVAPTGLTPRQVGDRPVADQYALLVDLLAETGAGGRIPLFAEPGEADADGSRRWFTALPGDIRRFGQLDAAARQAVQKRLATDRRAIEASADLLEAGRRPRDAALLRAALSAPGTGALFLVGDQPVLVAWGHDRQKPAAATPSSKPDDPATVPTASASATAGDRAGDSAGAGATTAPGTQAGPVPTTDLAPPAADAPETVTDAPPPPRKRRRRLDPRQLSRLGWVAALLLFVALLIRLVPACPPWSDACAGDPAVRLAVSEAETARQQLQSAFRRAQTRLADPACAETEAMATGIADGSSQTVPMPGSPVPPPPAPGSAVGGPATGEPDPSREPATAAAAGQTVPRFSLPALSPDRFDARLAAAGASDAEAQVTLLWDGDADLDLALICPNGDRVAWNVPSACGWRMDVEANAMAPLSDTPVENIAAAGPDDLPPGRYQVAVTAFLARSAQFDPVGYAVRVQIGDRRLVAGGSVRQGDPADIALTFDLPLDP